jgi:pantoate--beta-alanine ligase
MRTIESLEEIRQISESLRQGLKTIALVPTMGYLHDGHLALLEKARSRADVVVASIFVNPTQFAEGEDLAVYPRDPEGDARKLESAGCDLLFTPSVSEIYPPTFGTYVSVEGITSLFEGSFRPTHFRGVTTIVAKLFNIIRPHLAVFGQKDAQQVAVIRKMIADLDYDIRLVVVETMREADGLAMSSRNVYLTEEDRAHALTISRALRAAREALAAGAGVEDARFRMREELSPAIELDYAEIIDGDLFEPATDHSQRLVGIFAGRIGRTRLIDNMALK